jgi:hypothetical protein
MNIQVSVAAVLVSGFLAFTAWLQWRTARQKLALDLYDRRIGFYHRIRAFVIAISNRSEDGHDTLMSFARDTDEARFYFGDDLRSWFDLLYFHSLSALSLNEKLYPSQGYGGLPVGPDREDVAARYSAEVAWLTEQMSGQEVMFAPYLSLGDATVPRWPGFRARRRRKIKESWERAKAEVALGKL